MNMMLTLLINITLSLTHNSIAFWLPQLNIYTEKAGMYECSFDPTSTACLWFSVKFFLVGVMLLFFNLDITLFLPLARATQSTSLNSVMIMSFILVSALSQGLIYEWLHKGLEWTE